MNAPLSLRFLLALATAACALVLTPHGSAQQNQRTPPHIGFVYPAGGQQGTTIVMSVGGQNLNGTSEAFFNGPGLTATVKSFDRPLTQKEFNDLREKLQELQQKRAAALGRPAPERPNAEAKKAKAEEKAGKEAPKADVAKSEAAPAVKPTWTAEDERMLAELREKIAKRPNRQGNPALAETVTLEVIIAPDAAPGTYDLRVKGPAGISNPMVVQVGELPEFAKPVVTATNNPQPRGKREPNQRPTRPQPADTEIALPIIVNGQILPGEVDRYRFSATKGQHLTVAVSARSLLPYLADAVPGWFQATLALYDPQGREVAYSDSFRFSPDPVVNYEIPADGTYAIEIHDSIYRGREDFVYRIAMGELPFVTSIFPLGGALSEAAQIRVDGWNLPASTLTLNTKDKAPGQFLLSVKSRGQLSNAVRFALESDPAVRAVETNHTTSTAQTVTLPIVVDGRITAPGQPDVYEFNGKAGDQVIAEVFARRLGSPLDSLLTLTDATGKQLAINDDCEDKGAGLMTHHADSRISFKLPADGSYFVTLADAQRHGGPDYGYRLRISAPRPDFELRVVPSAVNIRAGSHVPITVYALRHDGFDGDIVLSLKDAPLGFALAGARIPAGQDKVQLTITGPGVLREEPVRLTMIGAAAINGEAVAHVAVPAEDMMQAFAYHHLVTAKEWIAFVSGRPTANSRIVNRGPLQIPAGGTAKLSINTTTARGIGKVTIELSDPPEGISVKKATASGDTVEIILASDPAKAKAGLKGNLILNAFGERLNATPAKGQKTPPRIPLGSVPAVPFEVVPAAVASN